MRAPVARALGLSRRGRAAAAATPAYAVAGNDPKTVADFEAEYYRTGGSDTTFASMFSFARASDATYVDSDGVLQTASSGVARVGHHVYEGGAWVDKGLLLESEARTNLLTRSEAFDHADWSKTNSPSLTQDETGPDGATSAWTFQDSGAGGTAVVQIFQGVTVATSTTYTFSVLAKQDQLNWFSLRTVGFTTPTSGNTWFDLANGAVGTTHSDHTARIESWGNGFYRCSITFTTDGTDTSGAVAIELASGDGGRSVDADGTSSIIIFGAQTEAGGLPSSYIKTTTAAATRAAETLTIAGADMAASTSAMSFQMDGEINYTDNGTSVEAYFARWQADGSNHIHERLTTFDARTGAFLARQTESGTTDQVETASGTYSPGLNVAFNVAARHTSGAVNAAADGTSGTEDTTPTALPDLSATTFELGYDFMGAIAKFRQWDVDLGDAGIEEASA